MTRKGKGDDSNQSERFKQTARELGVELDEAKLKEALRRMGKQPSQRERKDGEEG